MKITISVRYQWFSDTVKGHKQINCGTFYEEAVSSYCQQPDGELYGVFCHGTQDNGNKCGRLFVRDPEAIPNDPNLKQYTNESLYKPSRSNPIYTCNHRKGNNGKNVSSIYADIVMQEYRQKFQNNREEIELSNCKQSL